MFCLSGNDDDVEDVDNGDKDSEEAKLDREDNESFRGMFKYEDLPDCEATIGVCFAACSGVVTGSTADKALGCCFPICSDAGCVFVRGCDCCCRALLPRMDDNDLADSVAWNV